MSRMRTVLAAAILAAAALIAPAVAVAGPPEDSGPVNSIEIWSWRG